MYAFVHTSQLQYINRPFLLKCILWYFTAWLEYNYKNHCTKSHAVVLWWLCMLNCVYSLLENEHKGCSMNVEFVDTVSYVFIWADRCIVELNETWLYRWWYVIHYLQLLVSVYCGATYKYQSTKINTVVVLKLANPRNLISSKWVALW